MNSKLNLLFSLFIFVSYGQFQFNDKLISNKTNLIIKEIEKVNELMGEMVYANGRRPKQWDNFEKLKKNVSKKELIELTNHPNGVVRTYSFWALSYKKEVDLFPIVKKHIYDTLRIQTQFGCIGDYEMVGDYFINIMTPEIFDNKSKKFNKKEIKELDSLLIYTPNNLKSRFFAIANAEPTENLYPIIRELVIKENNQSALISLAKYKKEQDIELIINNRDKTNTFPESGYEYSFIAMEIFPRDEYFQVLESRLKNTYDEKYFSIEWRELYSVIASYKNEKSLQLLKTTLNEIKESELKDSHIRYIWEAILFHKDKIYDELYWKIWEEEKFKSLEIYKYLYTINPSKVYELTKKDLIINYQVKESIFVPNLEKVEESKGYYDYLLNVVKANDTNLYNFIIEEKIRTSDISNFRLYTSKVEKQDIFVRPLLDRLEKDDNPHVYLNIIKTLIEFKDLKINKEILEIRKRNIHMNENWWSDSLDELLKENNIK